MKLRKLIPTAVLVLLTVSLSVGLFATGIPSALATEEPKLPQVWEQIQSGVVYGADWTLYPYSYTMYVEDQYTGYDAVGNPYLDSEIPDMLRASIYVELDSADPVVIVTGRQCVMEAELYIPALDRYVTRTAAGLGSYFVAMSEAENGVIYPGELVRATAWFFVMDRHVGTLQWYPDSGKEAVG